jgi:hypothetical protein
MRKWEDEDFDWKGLNDCIYYISYYCRKYARLGGDAKEKYRQVRFYAHFGNLCLHSIVYPGYVYNQFPKWLWNIDCKYIGPALQFCLEKPFVKWQMFIYSRAYTNAVHKWSHLRAEILCGADYLDLLPKFTHTTTCEICYKSTIHVLGWDSEYVGARTSCFCPHNNNS